MLKKLTSEKIFALASVMVLFAVLAVFSYFGRRSSVPVESDMPSASAYFFDEDRRELQDPFITPGPGAEKIILSPIIDGRDPQLGSDDAPITIVQFSDFSCYFCAQQQSKIREFMAENEGMVRLIWKDFPDQDTVYYQAALAARCAGDQGKFWTLHDLLFLEGENFFSLSLQEAAAKAGLDADKLDSCLRSAKFDDDIKRNLQEARALRLPGVPFFFINGQEYLGAIDKEDLEKAIKNER